ncbi:hypothetical protein J7400_10755 [Shimia sp. R9_2]|uniref:hypothetical protein n=1 Tax=Shimia sp. R9_2 TaxID=2821112 RepID=UPI001ADAF90E|nr:hypothetical protein [Shimia sp. R9_2]MBO9397161.1 hypothetical protein [Shimia sp. R9_2]
MKQSIFRVVALCGGAAFTSVCAPMASAESLADKIKRGAENAGEAIGDGLSATGHWG